MHVNFFNEDNGQMSTIGFAPHQKPKKHYGFFRFLWDIIMVFLTGGLWLIWIFVREMRKR